MITTLTQTRAYAFVLVQKLEIWHVLRKSLLPLHEVRTLVAEWEFEITDLHKNRSNKPEIQGASKPKYE
jgi:hypothetical protein